MLLGWGSGDYRMYFPLVCFRSDPDKNSNVTIICNNVTGCENDALRDLFLSFFTNKLCRGGSILCCSLLSCRIKIKRHLGVRGQGRLHSRVHGYPSGAPAPETTGKNNTYGYMITKTPNLRCSNRHFTLAMCTSETGSCHGNCHASKHEDRNSAKNLFMIFVPKYSSAPRKWSRSVFPCVVGSCNVWYPIELEHI